MMGAWLFTLGLCLAAANKPDPADLIRKLGSGQFRERVEATRALDSLGQDALPALRAAKDSADPRVRARVLPLLDSLERRAEILSLSEPRKIQLDFHDRPISEVIDDLNRRHDLGLAFQFGPLPDRRMMFARDQSQGRLAELQGRRITLEASRALPFWEAIDRLCEATGTHHDLHPESAFGLSPGRFLLYSDLGRTTVASDSGAFRVLVTGLHSTFERNFLEPSNPANPPKATPPGRAVDRRLNVGMTVVAEPGRVVRQVGSIKLDEAIDDQGRNLLPPEHADESPANGMPYRNQPPTLNGFTGFGAGLTLRLVDPTARSIQRLRGSIPVTIVAYARNPIVIPLAGAAGKTVRNKDVTVSVLEVVTDANGSTTVEVGVVSNEPADRGFQNRNQTWPPDFATFQPDQITNRLEMFDAQGRKLALDWSHGHGNDQFTIRSRVRLTPRMIVNNPAGLQVGQPGRPPGQRPIPVELRYHDFAQVTTEIRFEFRNVPLP